MTDLVHDLGCGPGKRRPPGEEPEQQCARRIEVATRVNIVASELFGRQVFRRADPDAETSLLERPHLRNAKIGDLELSLASDEQIHRLDVAMHDLLGVSIA